MSNLKYTRIFDLNLFTGSSEAMRQELKGIHYNLNGLAFEEASNLITTTAIDGYQHPATGRDQENFSPMPFLKYPVIFSGYSENIRSDDEWLKYFIGGTFAEKNYNGIYNERVYSDHFIDGRILPYGPAETAQLDSTIEANITLTTEYYQYYSRYQAHVDNLESELMIPNYYFLEDSLFSVSTNELNYPRHQYPLIKDYLDDTYVNTEKELEDYADKKNLFLINSDYISAKNSALKETDSNYIANEDDLSKIYSLMPFANKIEIGQELTRVEAGQSFKDILENRDYQFKFLKILKEVFQEEISLRPATVNFGLNVTEQRAVSEDSYATFEDTQTTPLRLVDLPTALVYAYKNTDSETSDNFVIDQENHMSQVDMFSDNTGKYRHLVVDKTLEVFNDMRDLMKQNFEGTDFYDIGQLQRFLNKANEAKYYETMAFRVEKIGGAPTGDARTQNTVQNIWFYNQKEAIRYVDTQVKYGTEYTYNIYSYVLVQGYKYRFSDLSVSRRLSIREEESQPTVYCLELYNPQTGENVARKGARSFVSPETATEVAALASENRELGRQELFIDGMLSNNNGFLTALGYAVTTAADSYPYISSSQVFEDSEFVDYPFRGEAQVEGAIRVLSEVDFDFGTFTDEEQSRADQLTSTVSYATLENKASLTAEAITQRDTLNDIKSTLEERQQDINDRLIELDPFTNITGSTLFTDSQILVEVPYIAEANISIEPSLKIIEIPLEQKSMTILDHAPNDLVVSPYHLIDQSNRLAFYMKYDTFSANTEGYPVAITQADSLNEQAYKIGKDFVSNSKTKEEAVSPARFIEIFRTTTKPTSYQSFDENLRKTIDLRNSSGDIETDAFFKEAVEVNKKYYYMFRVVSELGVAGQPSPVFEAELVNDGGYVYGSFKQLSSSDLAVSTPKSPLMPFKKLINIVPNIRHLSLNTNAEMFSNSSTDEIGNIELGDQSLLETIWDEKFKIRLTSKKTGRKIDLNLKFEKKVSK